MKRTFTVAEAPIAVVLSLPDYHRLGRASPDFWSAYEAWRADTADDDRSLPEDCFADVRDRTPGRGVSL